MVGKALWNVYQIMNRPSINAPGSATDAYRPADWGKYGSDEDQMIYLAPNISEVTEVKTGTGSSQKQKSLLSDIILTHLQRKIMLVPLG